LRHPEPACGCRACLTSRGRRRSGAPTNSRATWAPRGPRAMRRWTPCCPGVAGRWGRLVEVLQPQAGQGEWRLLLPALGVGTPPAPSGGALVVPALAAQGLDASRLLVLQGPMLARDAAARVWACEQALRGAGVSAVLAWLPQVRPEQLRRLQMAAQNFQQQLFVMRPLAAQQEASPAVLRLLLEAGRGRGRADAAPAQAPRPAADHAAGAAGAARAAAGLACRQPPAVRAPPPGPWHRSSRRGPGCANSGQRGAGGAGAHPRPCWRGPIRRSRCTGSPCCPCRPLSAGCTGPGRSLAPVELARPAVHAARGAGRRRGGAGDFGQRAAVWRPPGAAQATF
jgi:cell division inhibitor SulA